MSEYTDELLARRSKKDDDQTQDETTFNWWEPCDDDNDLDEEYIERQRAASLIDCARSLDSAQREIHTQNMWSAQLYSNRELAAFDWGNGQLVKASMSPISRTGENITVRVVDTLVALLGKNRPKPKPVARGASFHLRQTIRKLDKFLYGEFQRNHVYSITKQAFRDACIFGFGCVKITVEDDPEENARVKYERVFPDEILVDQLEIVACGKIRHFYRRRVLPIEVIQATYKITDEQAAELVKQSSAGFSYLDYRPVGKGWAVVVEGYQLDGRWMVAADNIVLDEGEWPHDWLPYVFYHWQTPVSGFYSPSVVEQVIPYQIRLNEINEVIRDAQDIMGRPRILVAEGSRVNPMEVDNVVGRFIKYTGIKPEAVVWPAINAELYNERDRLVQTCLDHFGVSQTSSNATMPGGTRYDSAPAMREVNQMQDDRLADPAQRFEEMHLELATRTIQCIGASGKNPKTVWYSGWKHSKAEEIEWKDLGAKDNDFVMTMEAVSIFTMSPASARDELEKQLAMGLITPEQYRLELSDMDTEGAYTLQAAAAEDLLRVQELLEAGDFESPIPQQDLVNGITQMTLGMLNLMKYKDVPAKTILNFVNWITLAEAMTQKGTDTSGTMPEEPQIDPMTGQPMPPASMMPQQGQPPGQLGGAPNAMPVPESMGLSVAAPGAAPGIT